MIAILQFLYWGDVKFICIGQILAHLLRETNSWAWFLRCSETMSSTFSKKFSEAIDTVTVHIISWGAGNQMWWTDHVKLEIIPKEWDV